MKAIPLYLDIFLDWQALLDIALIAAGLFFLYRTLVRLGTWKIVIGMLVAFGLFVLASLLNLEGIEWIFKNVSHIALLGLVIVFQPEIRKIFEKMVSFTVLKSARKEDGTFSLVAQSLWDLAGQKRGAIIVFPGREEIENEISGGYPLNAQPSVPLIMSIFDPNSPGHDGALIIADNVLNRFGVRLPISKSSRLSDEYGTRHHAAMGMAEETDALVLLVSEERGHVSAFRDGTMKRLHSKDDVERELARHFEIFGVKKMVRQIPMSRRSYLQIGGSLLIAMVFWATMILGQKQVVERTLTVPVVYTSPTKGLILMGERVGQVAILTAGSKSELQDFVLSEPTVVVDLSGMQAGKQTFFITEESIKHPGEVSLLDISPSELQLSLEEIVQKTISITPQLIGQLPEGLKLNKVEVFPQELQVLAPLSRRENGEAQVLTTPIYLHSITGTSRIVCKLIAPQSIQPLEKNWPNVEVYLTVEELQRNTQ